MLRDNYKKIRRLRTLAIAMNISVLLVGICLAFPMIPNDRSVVDTVKEASMSITGQREWQNWIKQLDAERSLESHSGRISSELRASNPLNAHRIGPQQSGSENSAVLTPSQVWDRMRNQAAANSIRHRQVASANSAGSFSSHMRDRRNSQAALNSVTANRIRQQIDAEKEVALISNQVWARIQGQAASTNGRAHPPPHIDAGKQGALTSSQVWDRIRLQQRLVDKPVASTSNQDASNSLTNIAKWLKSSAESTPNHVPTRISTMNSEQSALVLLFRFIEIHPEMEGILSGGSNYRGFLSNTDRILLKKMGVHPDEIAVMSPTDVLILTLLDGLTKNDRDSKIVLLKLGLDYSAVKPEISIEDGKLLKALGVSPEELLNMSAKDVKEFLARRGFV